MHRPTGELFILFIRNATIDYLHKEIIADKYRDYYKVYTSLACNTTEEMVELNNLEEALEKGLQTLSRNQRKFSTFAKSCGCHCLSTVLYIFYSVSPYAIPSESISEILLYFVVR